MAEKKHMSVVICGHVDSGKSTTTGRLLFELGGIEERTMTKLKEEVIYHPLSQRTISHIHHATITRIAAI